MLRGTIGRSCAWLLATLALGCSSPDYDPPTLINQLRVLAVRAEPPWLGPATTKLDMLAVGSDAPLCYAWQLCLFAWSEGGNYRCLDPELAKDLGTAPTAATSVFDLLGLLPNVAAVLERKGLLPPAELSTGPGSGGSDSGTEPESDSGLEVQVLFLVGEASLWGGTCPTVAEALARPCPDRSRCIAGYKSLALGIGPSGTPDPRVAHANPTLTGLRLGQDGDGLWLPGVVLRIAATVPREPTLEDLQRDTNGLRLDPTWTPESVELVQPSADPGLPDQLETLTFDWYSTAGTFDYRETGDNVSANGYQAEAKAETVDGAAVRFWLVVRDSRGGADWLSRDAVIATLADDCVAALPGAATCIAR